MKNSFSTEKINRLQTIVQTRYTFSALGTDYISRKAAG